MNEQIQKQELIRRFLLGCGINAMFNLFALTAFLTFLVSEDMALVIRISQIWIVACLIFGIIQKIQSVKVSFVPALVVFSNIYFILSIIIFAASCFFYFKAYLLFGLFGIVLLGGMIINFLLPFIIFLIGLVKRMQAIANPDSF